MKTLSGRVSLILKNAGAVVIEFPAAVAFGFFLAVLLSFSGGAGLSDGFTATLAVSLMLGATTNLLLPVVGHRFGVKEIWNLAFTGIGIAIPFAAFLLLYTSFGSQGFEINAVRLTVISFLEIIAAFALLVYKKDEGYISKIARVLVKNLVVGVFCALFVFVILALPMLLISITVWSGVFELISKAVIIALFLIYLFLLNALSELIGKRKQVEDPFPDFMDRLVPYLIIPLITIWFIYTAVWLIRGMLWNNWAAASDIFSHIFPMCCTGYFVFLLTYSMEDRGIFRAYRNLFTVGCVPIIIIGIWRLVDVVMVYGFTEKRYFAFLGLVLLAVGELYLIFNPKNSGLPVLVTAAVLAVFSVLPALNFEDVSAYTQVRRAESIMVRNGMLSGDDITSPDSISEQDRIELSRALEYICSNGKETMAKWLPLNFDFKNDYVEVFGISGEYDAEGNSTVTSAVLVGELSSQYYNISEYDIALVNYVSYNLYNFSMDNIIGRNGMYSVKITDYADENITVATVVKDGITVLEQEITDELGNIATYLSQNVNNNNDTVYMPMGMMNIHLESKDVELLVVLKSVTMARSENDDKRLTTALTDTILLKEIT